MKYKIRLRFSKRPIRRSRLLSVEVYPRRQSRGAQPWFNHLNGSNDIAAVRKFQYSSRGAGCNAESPTDQERFEVRWYCAQTQHGKTGTATTTWCQMISVNNWINSSRFANIKPLLLSMYQNLPRRSPLIVNNKALIFNNLPISEPGRLKVSRVSWGRKR